mmetsp:Transcript_50339/g.96137  ORF Transcript_50339/g.96137 Transcript_50339/m.96137 type:complete len:205 (-) Transcript_50339:841-1455(-)
MPIAGGPSTRNMSTTKFTNPDNPATLRGVAGSLCPRQHAAPTIETSVKGRANARQKRYSAAGAIISLPVLSRLKIGVVHVSNTAHAATPLIQAMSRPSDTAFPISFFSDFMYALATIAVVAVVRNWNIIPTNPKMVVFGPRAASPMEDICPTQAVSTKDMRGSANTAPIAGRAKVTTCFKVRGSRFSSSTSSTTSTSGTSFCKP